ncbi:restriction endonuclease subunit S [Thiothrix lacustris]|uniref:restriction endonuclease subunit S n=1 Tax=Thiothrix lacustris TaxID=525917 RepID=UPI0004906AFA|nr:restriction endonuclease subunit S [Thiothrix lacustris]
MSEIKIPAGYKQTEVGLIPEDWDVIELGALNPFVTSGSRGWADFYAEYGDPFIRITNLNRLSIDIDLSNLKCVRLQGVTSEGVRTSLHNGDVLISITADIGIIGYVDATLPKPSFINQHIALVRFPDSVDSKFISYFLASENIQKIFLGATDQGAKAGLNLPSIRKIKIVNFKKKEQTAIATVLSDVDALIASLNAQIAKKRDIKTATMQQLLTGKQRLAGFGEGKGMKSSELGEIPEDWEVAAIGDLAIKVGSGITPKGGSNVYTQSGRPFVRSQNIGWGVLIIDDLAYIDEQTHDSFSATELKCGDVLLNITGASIGRSAIATIFLDGGNVNQHVCIIRAAENKAIPTIINYLLLSQMGQDQIASFQSGGNREGLNFKQIRSMLFALPTEIEEQGAIAGVLSAMDEEIAALEQRLAKTKALKQGMMQELLTGRTRLV